MPEGCVDDLAGTLRIDAASLTVRFKRGLPTQSSFSSEAASVAQLAKTA